MPYCVEMNFPFSETKHLEIAYNQMAGYFKEAASATKPVFAVKTNSLFCWRWSCIVRQKNMGVLTASVISFWKSARCWLLVGSRFINMLVVFNVV